MTALGKYETYKKLISNLSSDTPCVPELVVTLQDLHFLEEVMETIEEEYVNWEKLEKIAKIIRLAKKFNVS